ncbi:Kdo hydroxylase family protein [Paludibacterium yongneupense]|uniref:Kdo hydroxylase family protein n=1 Tax=Paludibacterium yongneupense TaxID=400061 RepID=UPI00041A09FE|nr:Kdo hydroxylase family protein [Paludibacterium yongneupense]
MSHVIPVSGRCWNGADGAAAGGALLEELEAGKALYFPEMSFELSADEVRLLAPHHADPARKNISLAGDGSTLHGVVGPDGVAMGVRSMLERFRCQARQLIDGICPAYGKALQVAPASLRLHRVEGRCSSWRKDDSRLHVDAFPSRPLAGKRILRVFSNINPQGEPRVWRIGEAFPRVARRFAPAIRPPLPGSAGLLHLLGVTKSRRTAYDHFMLGLHDAMKGDADYQRACEQETVPFAPGSSWVCFSDQTSHAVMSGQFMLEQTFFLSPSALLHPELSPLSILEALTGRRLL